MLKIRLIGLDETQKWFEKKGVGLRAEISTVVRQTASEYRDSLRSDLTRRTGALQRSVSMIEENPFKFVVGSPLKYARFVEFGTRPHMIYPRRAKALHFFTREGKEVFAKRVRHPGTRPTFIWKNQLKIAMKTLRSRLERIINPF